MPRSSPSSATNVVLVARQLLGQQLPPLPPLPYSRVQREIRDQLQVNTNWPHQAERVSSYTTARRRNQASFQRDAIQRRNERNKRNKRNKRPLGQRVGREATLPTMSACLYNWCFAPAFQPAGGNLPAKTRLRYSSRPSLGMRETRNSLDNPGRGNTQTIESQIPTGLYLFWLLRDSPRDPRQTRKTCTCVP